MSILRDMYEVLGDPTNALEEYTDPKSFWEKRGRVYEDLGNGFHRLGRFEG